MINSIQNIQDMNIADKVKETKIKAEISKNKNYAKDSFHKLLNEKIKPDGTVDQSKLKGNEKKLYDACVELESFLWKQMLNAMRKTVDQYRLFDKSMAEDVFTDFLYNEYSMTLAKNAKTKISDEMFRQLSRL